MLGLLSPSGTGLEKFYKFYGDQDSQSVSVIACKNFTNSVNFSGCPTYLTYLCQMGTYSISIYDFL